MKRSIPREAAKSRCGTADKHCQKSIWIQNTTTQEVSTIIEQKLCNPIAIEISKLHPFENHPYKVLDNEEMETLTESIRDEGVLSPLIVRPLEGTDEYEVISGHRRLHAAQRAGLSEVPALVYEISREEAAIMLVDSNLHREHILPSEKAFAYKLKMEALKHCGITCGQVVHKSREAITDDDSGRQVQRYIRLTFLRPGILKLVDAGRISLTPAVEISYLNSQEQADLLYTMESEDCTPSLAQAKELCRQSQAGLLDMDSIFKILSQRKPNQREKFKIPMDKIRKFFPKSYSQQQIENAIVLALQKEARRRADREGRWCYCTRK